jgi:predicted AAA+ superfamily ATPase
MQIFTGKMLERKLFLHLLQEQMKIHPVVALLGPRQCGKTTLAEIFSTSFNGATHRFDLENPQDLLALSNPMVVLERLTGLVVIDEIQRLPEIFPILRVLSDKKQASYLILGSASRDLIKQSSETLAGRIGYIELTPFLMIEGCMMNQLLVRGGFPRSYLASDDRESYLWRESYIQTFLERDIPNLGFNISPLLLRRFWMMLTQVHGSILNMSSLAVSLGVSAHSIRHYVEILAGTFMLRIMPPWFENIHKRQVKTPKIFFSDSGLLLTLLGIHSEKELLMHPNLGTIWEGFALEQVIRSLRIRPEESFFWRTQDGAELDLLVFKGSKRLGFEFKFSDSPKTTKSMHSALSSLKLDHLFIIYPGRREIPLRDNISLIGLEEWTRNQAKMTE